MSEWLKSYFGRDYEQFHPDIVMEKKHVALVRLCNPGMNRLFSSLGYVIIQKNGRHIATGHISMFEGVPTDADMKLMKERLEAEERKHGA